MAAYRFCRTDDIGLLVDALNRCWAPHFPGEPLMTAASFKRSIRDLQVWCSSCMVALAEADPIGVLIGAKRPSATLIYRIAVHPDYLRQGHARHMLASLGSKLAILGPPRIIAEVPESLEPASGLFRGGGFSEETSLGDYEWQRGQVEPRNLAAAGGFLIPITIDDLTANGALETHPGTCWERSIETLSARKDETSGLAVASDERIEAYVLYSTHGGSVEIVALRSLVDDGGARLKHLLGYLGLRETGRLWFPRVHPAEISKDQMEALGFTETARHRLFSTTARNEG